MACSLAAGSVALAQSQPAPSPSPIALPEIGRVRAITPSCAVMRDLVIPSWQNAQKADARFTVNAAPRLPKYLQIIDEDPSNPARAMQISYLDQQVGLMKEDLLHIADALGDYRLQHPRDAQTALLRQKLQDLYDAQSGRANILWEFIQRQRIAMARNEIKQLNNMQTAGGGQISASPEPNPGQTPEPYAMPHLTGIGLQDERTMAAWGQSMTAAVRDTEENTAPTFAAVANSCR